jgi:Rieske Fe-S protein
MTMDSSMTRRAVLAAGVAGAGAVALAACSPGSKTAGGSAVGQSSAQPLAKLSDVPVGGAKAVKLPDGSPGVVARPQPDTAVCFTAICTHQGCTVAVNGAKLDCPCHQSVFNALTGAVEQGPATQALAKVPVKVENGEVVTA